MRRKQNVRVPSALADLRISVILSADSESMATYPTQQSEPTTPVNFLPVSKCKVVEVSKIFLFLFFIFIFYFYFLFLFFYFYFLFLFFILFFFIFYFESMIESYQHF